MIDNISKNRIPQFRDGGFNECGNPTNERPSSPNESDPTSTALLAEITRLNNLLESGIFAVIDDDTTIGIFRKFNELNTASGDAIET